MAAPALLISNNIEASMDQHGFGDLVLFDSLQPEWQVLGLLVAYCLLMAVSTLRVFQKQDTTTGR